MQASSKSSSRASLQAAPQPPVRAATPCSGCGRPQQRRGSEAGGSVAPTALRADRQRVRAGYSVGPPAHARAAHDIVLSSGFLAFAQHAGFLQAVEEAGVNVAGVMGTSAGALTGSLYAAGYSPKEAAALLSERAPIQLLSPCFEPWRGGLLSLDGVVERLAELLPATFEGLERDFAVGVVTAGGEHVLIDRGPLPEAVAASAAIPLIFSSVDVPGGLSGLKDGGMVDRVGLRAWRQRRRQQHQLRNGASHGSVPPCLVHVIERSSPFSGADDAEASGEDAVQVVRCPKSGVNFFDLGDFDRQFHVARSRASSRLQEYLTSLPAVLQQQQQQQQRAAAAHDQHEHASSGGGVLGSARRQPAAAAAATAAQPATGAPPGAGAISSGLVVPPPSSNSLLAPRSPGGSAGRSSATRRANEE